MKKSAILLALGLLSCTGWCEEGGKKYTSLEEALKNPDAVEELDLSDSGLRELSSDIGKFRNLKKLDLSKNELTILPRAIAGLGRLEELDLRGNTSVCLPVEIKSLAALTKLGLDRHYPAGRMPRGDRAEMKARELARIHEMRAKMMEEIARRPELAEKLDTVMMRLTGETMMLVPTDPAQAWEHVKAMVPDIQCKVEVAARGSVVHANVADAEGAGKGASLHLHVPRVTGAEPFGISSVMLKQGTHRVEVFCRLKTSPLFYGTVFAGDVKVTGDALGRVKELIKQLGATSHNARTAAEEGLLSLGAPITPYLRAAADDPDPERRMRARNVLKHLAAN